MFHFASAVQPFFLVVHLLVKQLTSFFHAVSVIWNGSTITGPVLIYHDEIPRNPLLVNGLLCRSQISIGVAWYLTNETSVRGPSYGDAFYQTKVSAGMTSRLLRIGVSNGSTAAHNGLWSCRLSGDAGNAIPVGLYQRGREYYSYCICLILTYSQNKRQNYQLPLVPCTCSSLDQGLET